MAFRAAAYLKSRVINGGLGGSSNFTTSTSPKLKAYPPKHINAKFARGDFVAICIAMGMIVVSSSLGIYTALRELGQAPNVLVKSRRETIPEVVEPEQVAEKFVKQSLFRKVAHLNKSDHQHTNASCVYTRSLNVETLKDIGLDPKL